MMRRPKPKIDGVNFQNLSHRLSGSLGSFFMIFIIQRLRFIKGIKSQTYPQLALVFNNLGNTRPNTVLSCNLLIYNVLKIKFNFAAF